LNSERSLEIADTRLTVIIVGWNARDHVRACLQSISAHPPTGTVEVIYVDNASLDASSDVVRVAYPQATIIANAANLGFQKANNQALRLARGEYIVLLNPDTEVRGGALDELMHFLDARPDVAAVSPRCEFPDGRLQWSIGGFPTVPTLWHWCCATHPVLRAVFGLPRVSAGQPDSERTQEQDYAYGACFMVRRAAVADVGLMDERFFLAGGDVAWSVEMKRRGWRIYYVAAARIVHHESVSRNRMPDRGHFDWISAHRRVLYRYEGAASGLAGDAVFAVHLLLLALERLAERVRRAFSVYWAVLRPTRLHRGRRS
jgi:GT2 family glycosyltransferase